MNMPIDRYETFPYEKLNDAYMAEVNPLIYTSSLPTFHKMLDQLSDYPKYIRSLRKQKSPLITILEASNNTRIIDRSCSTPQILNIIYTAHLAACCQMLMDIRLPVNQLEPDSLRLLAQQSMVSAGTISDNDSIRRTGILASMDAIRTIHILKSFGLITRPSDKTYQIAFGAGSGKNDIDSIHRIPEIKYDETNKQKYVTFKVKQNKVTDIILVDADPGQHDNYTALNENKQTGISAYNDDAIETLKFLVNANIKKRNMVTLLRMEHRMIPDVKVFLHYLASIIDNDCDFILSIGSGDSIEDFEGRTNKVKEFYDCLETSNLNPVIIKLHNPGTLEEQWSSLAFGHPSLASYQILYCKLNPKKLSQQFQTNE